MKLTHKQYNDALCYVLRKQLDQVKTTLEVYQSKSLNKKQLTKIMDCIKKMDKINKVITGLYN